jgi:hypothetical protein
MAFLLAGILSYNVIMSTTSNIYSMVKAISDYEILDVKSQLDKMDIECKLDVIEKLLTKQIESEFKNSLMDTSMVMIPSKNLFKTETNPIGRCLYYLCEAIEWIHHDLIMIHSKIAAYKSHWISYIKNPNLNAELKALSAHVELLESRFDMYFKTLNIDNRQYK